jgi:hypothetical protein
MVKSLHFQKRVRWFTFVAPWKGAGVAELARLESVCTGNRTVGSNPTLSADRDKPLIGWIDGLFRFQ